MFGVDNSMMIAISEAREACKGKKSLPQRVSAAMKAVKHHWLVTDENKRFQSAIVAVLRECSEKERERVSTEMKALQTLNSMLSGVPVDVSTLKIPSRPLKLMGIWSGIK